jgi:hypothetical protein
MFKLINFFLFFLFFLFSCEKNLEENIKHEEFYLEESTEYESITDLENLIEENFKGIMTHNIPNKMKLGEVDIVKLRISRSKKVKEFKINSNDSIYSIKTSSIMKVSLIDGSNESFEIKEITNNTQFLSDDVENSYTEWSWNVLPKKSGNNKLILIIYIKRNTEFGTHLKGYPVFEDEILIETNLNWSLKNFISDNWNWLLSTLIIPFIILIYKNYKKKDKH